MNRQLRDHADQIVREAIAAVQPLSIAALYTSFSMVSIVCEVISE